MGQLILELDAATETKIKSAARSVGLQPNQWVMQLIQEKTASPWPEAVKALAGAWKDFPTAEEIRATSGNDSPREPL